MNTIICTAMTYDKSGSPLASSVTLLGVYFYLIETECMDVVPC